jgi:hypothetical protein
MVAITHTATLFLALAFLAGAGRLLDAQQRQASVPKAEQLTKAQFDALHDDQSIEVRGQRTTKRGLRAAAERNASEAKTQRGAARRVAEAEHTAEAAAFRRQEDARLERENARARARLAQIKAGKAAPAAGRERLQSEARQLHARAAKARTDAERAQIHQRAQELLAELAREK